ncbi:hypothetical protein SDC9_134786 [bioreactor metagenome]|uniref:Uncharacterized protein n=1 Tax=bioreactor metagenome TaxID=1076179 RepID=A0A645DE89_9ZZZZ
MLIREVIGEEASSSSGVITEDFDRGTVNGVVICNAISETIHEDGDGGDLHTTEGTNSTGLGHTSGEVASQEGGFIGLEGLTNNVGDGRIVGVIDDGEFDIGVGFSSSLGCISKQETDGHDQIAFLFNESVDVLLEIGNFFRLEVLTFDTQLGLCIGNTLPCGCIEGFVINTTGIGDLADLEFGLASCGSFGASGQDHSGHEQNCYNGKQLLGHWFSSYRE